MTPFEGCRVCWTNADTNRILLCDTCDAEYHIYCLEQPLCEVPSGMPQSSPLCPPTPSLYVPPSSLCVYMCMCAFVCAWVCVCDVKAGLCLLCDCFVISRVIGGSSGRCSRTRCSSSSRCSNSCSCGNSNLKLEQHMFVLVQRFWGCVRLLVCIWKLWPVWL